MLRRRQRGQPLGDVIVVGGGAGGLLTALALGRAGLTTTLVERDPLPDLPDAEAAFAAERRGTPQAHHTHGFLARLLVVLRDSFPDLLDQLLDAGSSTLSMVDHLGAAEPGDEDLSALVVRRSTFEWVLRRTVRAEANVTIRSGVGVRGLTVRQPDREGRPVVSGVSLEDGTRATAPSVVASTGARGDVVGWLAALGVPCPEQLSPSDLTYLTRWYRGPVVGGQAPRLFGHLPYVKVLAVPGDGDTLSVSLAVRLGDTELRRALSRPAAFDHACGLIPATRPIFGPGGSPLEPLSDVHPMAGLVNRTRRFTDPEGSPTTVGFHVVGDAHTTTNPLLGRGCALAAVQAVLLADAFRRHPADPVARAVRYEAGSDAEVLPWFENAVIMDALEAGRDTTALDPRAVDAARLVGGMFMVGADDPMVGRALARYINLLETPSQLLARHDLVAKVTELAAAHPDGQEAPPPGPTREELLAALHEMA